MRGTSSSCVFTPGADATATAVRPSASIDGSRVARFAPGDDERARLELASGGLERLLGGEHRHVLVLEPERHERAVGRVIDDQDGPAARDGARDVARRSQSSVIG